MNQQELRTEIWKGMPLLRRNLIGRQRVDRIISLAIQEAPVEILQHVQGNASQAEIVAATWKGAVKKGYSVRYGDDSIQFGPLFWIIAVPLIQYAIKWLIEWWMERRENREMFASWREELRR